MDLLGRFSRQCRRESEKIDKGQAWDLINSGWRMFPQSDDAAIMSWYWRSPPKRPGSDGRLYRSTNQAWMALQRLDSKHEGQP